MAAMLRRRATYNAHAQVMTREQTAIDFDACPPEPAPAVADQPATEADPGYGIKTGWVDITGKTRTWVLCEPSGEKLAEITTKRDAQKLADILNRVIGDRHGRSR